MFPCPGYCKYCCYEHRDAFIFLSYSFVQIYAKGVRLLDHTTNLVLGLWGTYGLKLNIQKTKIMASSPITSWQIDGEAMEAVTDFILGGSKITADGDCSHETKRRLLLGRKAMKKLDSILKSSDITLSTKVCLVKAMVFPVVIMDVRVGPYRKLITKELMLLNCGVGEDLDLRVPWTARRSNQSILKEFSPEYSFEGLMLKLQ